MSSLTRTMSIQNPFVWTKSAEEILASTFEQRSSQTNNGGSSKLVGWRERQRCKTEVSLSQELNETTLCG